MSDPRAAAGNASRRDAGEPPRGRLHMSGEKTICVYCASSQVCDAGYHDDARRLGVTLARHGYSVIYGGGAVGSRHAR